MREQVNQSEKHLNIACRSAWDWKILFWAYADGGCPVHQTGIT